MDNSVNISTRIGLALVVLYVFFNTVGLPHGLTWTLILTPALIYANWKQGLYKPYLYFAITAAAYTGIHFALGVNVGIYLRSLVLLFGAFVFGLSVYQFTQKSKESVAGAMKTVFIVNTFLLPIALILFFTPFKSDWWYLEPISPGLPIIPRLQMLTYEASYYSLLLVPVFLYYFMKSLFLKGYSLGLNLILIIPLILSFSLGVLGGLSISLLITYLLHIKWLVMHKRFRNSFGILAALGICVLLILIFVFPENALFARLENIPSGEDTSARGRTYEAFHLAWLMIREKSIWFGIGLGQIKDLGRDVIIQYYQYIQMPEVARIPNAAAETLAQYGIVGLSLRLIIQVVLFFKTRVWSNFYRLSLFLFVFLYQFTGSFMVNLAEIVLWVLAFSPIVPELDKSALLPEMRIPVNRWEKAKGGKHE